MNVLIVDDDKVFLQVAKAALEKRGFGTLIAEAGEEALAKIYSDEPEIVLLDVQMPRLTGDELVKMIKEWKPEIQVFMVSTLSDEAIKKECLDNGANAFFNKPVDFDDLALKINQAVSKR